MIASIAAHAAVVLAGGRRVVSVTLVTGSQAAEAAPQTSTRLAERAAVRALQACAPYDGLGGKSWRVIFP